ncbi:MAG: hypothetical protein ACRDPY_16985 [Streptosporangiaceae bacterium]
MTRADLLVLLPWLIFAAGVGLIGWRLMVTRGTWRRRKDRR